MSIDSRGSRCQHERVNDMPLRGAGGSHVSASTLPQGQWRSDAYETRQRRINLVTHHRASCCRVYHIPLYTSFPLLQCTTDWKSSNEHNMSVSNVTFLCLMRFFTLNLEYTKFRCASCEWSVLPRWHKKFIITHRVNHEYLLIILPSSSAFISSI